MIASEPLEQVLTGPGSRELGLDDRALETVLSLASQDRFVPAAELAQKLWQQQIYDVRIIGCYLFGIFFERGIISLSLIFECIRRALSQNLPYLSPTYKRERHLDMSLRWLFDSIVTQARFHERQKDEVWTKWNQDWQRASQNSAIERCTALLATLDEVMPGARSRQPLFHLQSLLEGMARASAISAGWDMKGATQIPAPLPPPDSPKDTSASDDLSLPSDDESPPDGGADSGGDDYGSSDGSDEADADREGGTDSSTGKGRGDGSEDDAADADRDSSASPSPSRGRSEEDEKSARPARSERSDHEGSLRTSGISSSAESSASQIGAIAPSSVRLSSQSTSLPLVPSLVIAPGTELQGLLQELSGFVQLAEKQRYRKAAVLLQHIRQTLQSFEPTRFFPALFSDYLLAMARHAGKLKPHMGEQVDLEQEALRLLCRSDLDRFLSDSER